MHDARSRIIFRKSSFSEPDKDCVEVAHMSSKFAIRDSKNAASPVLLFDTVEGTSFLHALRTGEWGV